MDGNKPVGWSSFCVGWMIGMLIYNFPSFLLKKSATANIIYLGKDIVLEFANFLHYYHVIKKLCNSLVN